MFEEVFNRLVNSNVEAALDTLEELALRDDVDHGALQELYEMVAEKQDMMASMVAPTSTRMPWYSFRVTTTRPLLRPTTAFVAP